VKGRRTGFPNPFGEGEWCDLMRRQAVTPVCDGLVCSALQGEASSPSHLSTPRGTASEFARRMFRKVDDQQQS
jgi:hypothetical protein